VTNQHIAFQTSVIWQPVSTVQENLNPVALIYVLTKGQTLYEIVHNIQVIGLNGIMEGR